MEEKMLIDAICCGLEDLMADLRSDETQSSLALTPQAKDLYRMAMNLQRRIADKAKVAA